MSQSSNQLDCLQQSVMEMKPVNGDFPTHHSFLSVSLSVHNAYLFWLLLCTPFPLSPFLVPISLSYLLSLSFLFASPFLSPFRQSCLLMAKSFDARMRSRVELNRAAKMRAMKTRRQLGLPACRARPHTRAYLTVTGSGLVLEQHSPTEWEEHFANRSCEITAINERNRFADAYSVWNGHIFQNRSLQFRT